MNQATRELKNTIGRIETTIATLAAEVSEMKKNDNANYGHVGSARYLESELAQMVRFLQNSEE